MQREKTQQKKERERNIGTHQPESEMINQIMKGLPPPNAIYPQRT